MTTKIGDAIVLKMTSGANLTTDELRKVAIIIMDSEPDVISMVVAQLCARMAETLDDVRKLDRRTAHFDIKPVGFQR